MISDFSIKKFISDSSNKKNKGFCIPGTYFSSGYQDTGTELFIFSPIFDSVGGHNF